MKPPFASVCLKGCDCLLCAYIHMKVRANILRPVENAARAFEKYMKYVGDINDKQSNYFDKSA